LCIPQYTGYSSQGAKNELRNPQNTGYSSQGAKNELCNPQNTGYSSLRIQNKLHNPQYAGYFPSKDPCGALRSQVCCSNVDEAIF
jgi:hypothetical protein